MNVKDFEKKLQDMEDRLDHEVKELKETVEADKQQIERLREEKQGWQKNTLDFQEQRDEARKEAEVLQKQLKAYQGLAEFVDSRFELLAGKLPKQEAVAPKEGEVPTTLIVQEVKPKIVFEEQSIKLTVTGATHKGEILRYIRMKKLDDGFRLIDVLKTMQREGWGSPRKETIDKELGELCSWQVLNRMETPQGGYAYYIPSNLESRITIKQKDIVVPV